MDDAVDQFRGKIHGMSIVELAAVSEIIKQKSRDFIEETDAVTEEIASYHVGIRDEKSPSLAFPIHHK